jgi:hypothetical protein
VKLERGEPLAHFAVNVNTGHYGTAVTDALGHPTAFAPPLPALTRYKKDVVDLMRKSHDAARAKVGRCRLTVKPS